MPYLWVPPAATKGRLLVADGTSWQPLTVGSNDQVLTADSGESTGVKWAAASSGSSDEDIWVPAGAMNATNGSPNLASITTSWSGWMLDDSNTEAVGLQQMFPSTWSTFHMDVWWVPISNSQANVRIRAFDPDFVTAGDTLGAPSLSDSTVAAPAQNVVKITRFLSGKTVTSGEVTGLRVVRVGNDAADTQSGDIAVLGVQFIKAS